MQINANRIYTKVKPLMTIVLNVRNDNIYMNPKALKQVCDTGLIMVFFKFRSTFTYFFVKYIYI